MNNENTTDASPAVEAKPAVAPEVATPKPSPVKPTKTPFESKLDQRDLSIGEKNVYEGVSMLIGALIRVAKEAKYTGRLIGRLERDDRGNPLIPYIKAIAHTAKEFKKTVDADPEFQAGLEQAERRAFMEHMMSGIQG